MGLTFCALNDYLLTYYFLQIAPQHFLR